MKFLAFALSDAGLRPLRLDQIRRSKTNNDIFYADHADTKIDGPPILVDVSIADAKETLKRAAKSLGAGLRLETENSLFFVWRSPVIGFPNGAYAYVESQEQGVKISLYGKALYGRRDFGANKGFIDQLAAAL